MNKDQELKKVSAEQKETILAWVEEKVPYREILELMAKPVPEGFGVRVSLGTLAGWIKAWRSEEVIRSMGEESTLAREYLEAEEESAVDFGKATIGLLQRRLFKAAMASGNERTQIETLRLLLEHEARMRRQELLESQHRLARERFEFNAAREAMKHWHAFKEIHEMNGPDDEDKIWLARDVVFVGPDGEKPLKQRQNADCKLQNGTRERMTNDNGTKDKGMTNVQKRGDGSEDRKVVIDSQKQTKETKEGDEPLCARRQQIEDPPSGEVGGLRMTNDNGADEKGITQTQRGARTTNRGEGNDCNQVLTLTTKRKKEGPRIARIAQMKEPQISEIGTKLKPSNQERKQRKQRKQ